MIVVLEDEGKVILKAYLSPDKHVIRIVLPEMKGYGQIRHFVENEVKYIQFYRDGKVSKK